MFHVVVCGKGCLANSLCKSSLKDSPSMARGFLLPSSTLRKDLKGVEIS